jgi:Domain of unknown function (DUF4388)
VSLTLIGTLEQFNLANILQRVETYSKTGLMLIKQGVQEVELYFRDGRLMCVGPVRTSATLGDRLLQDGVISLHALQETLLVVGHAQYSETRMALTLMDLGYVSHEELRTWATQKASEVLQVLLSWASGEIHFDDEVLPPAERLLVALSITTLLSAIPPLTPALQPTYRNHANSVPAQQELSRSAAHALHTPDVPTLISASDLLADAAPPTSVFSTESFSPALSPKSTALLPESLIAAPTLHPTAVTMPTPPKRIDTSFMRPDMVLMPVDLSLARERNPQIQLTPDQWRLLTKVDGHTSLRAACYELAMTPEMICQVAGELIAERLIQLSLPVQTEVSELSPVSRELVSSGLSNGFIAPGYSATAASPWSPAVAGADGLPQFASSVPFETQSQWGNGGNNASFVPGRGWIASPQPLQPLPTSGPLASSPYSDMYAYVVGGY